MRGRIGSRSRIQLRAKSLTSVFGLAHTYSINIAAYNPNERLAFYSLLSGGKWRIMLRIDKTS